MTGVGWGWRLLTTEPAGDATMPKTQTTHWWPRNVGALLVLLLLGVGSSACADRSEAEADASPDQAVSDGRGKPPQAEPDGVVARIDVDGDRKADTVYYRARSDDVGRVVVQTNAGDRLTRQLSTELWPRGEWHGAAPLDGNPGAELFIGTQRGAHTSMLTVLTYRVGGLQVMDNPAGIYGEEWPVDSFFNGYLGWTRTVVGGEVRLQLQSVLRRGASKVFTGEEQRFRWSPNGWVQTGTAPLSITGAKSAGRVGGWHVDGLARWPDMSGGTAV